MLTSKCSKHLIGLCPRWPLSLYRYLSLTFFSQPRCMKSTKRDMQTHIYIENGNDKTKTLTTACSKFSAIVIQKLLSTSMSL